MSPHPTGRLVGDDLVLTRTFRAPIEDVWASLTEPERTARWFGPWRGDAAPGRTVQVQMVHEETDAWMDVTVEACEPPTRLSLACLDEQGSWQLDLMLVEAAGSTELTFVQRGIDPASVGEIGPGWEFYLDALVAAREDRSMPDFDDYYPGMRSHFEAQRRE